MSELTVLLHPDPRLKKTCIPVTNIDKSIKKLCLDMIETMYKYSGVGLAASQVGILKRVVVMDCSEEGEKKPKILINPEIIWSSEDVSLFAVLSSYKAINNYTISTHCGLGTGKIVQDSHSDSEENSESNSKQKGTNLQCQTRK